MSAEKCNTLKEKLTKLKESLPVQTISSDYNCNIEDSVKKVMAFEEELSALRLKIELIKVDINNMEAREVYNNILLLNGKLDEILTGVSEMRLTVNGMSKAYTPSKISKENEQRKTCELL